MRWQLGRRSENVEDRRGRGVACCGRRWFGHDFAGGGCDPTGGDPTAIPERSQPPSQSNPSGTARRSPQEDQLADFVSVVLADTEDTWNNLFRRMGGDYREPKLVLFSNVVESACGYGKAAMGPFYCPRDQTVYIDLSFYRDLKNRHQAPGDFAQAYVIAHEIGHHVQKQLGISDKVQRLQSQVGRSEANQLSVRLELQADCFAGVWANHANRERQVLEPGDVDEALNAASAIGDDRLQEQATGYVVPDSFTHGSSAQRVRWFTQGLKTGNVEQCNTFNTARL